MLSESDMMSYQTQTQTQTQIFLKALLVVMIQGPASTSAVITVTTRLNDASVLPCAHKCSGVIKWSAFHKPGEVFARCNQTSCRSERGYEISHEGYLKGNLNLTIPVSDYSRRRRYTCSCGAEDVCDVYLRIDPVEFSRKIEHGGFLSVDIPVPERTEVIFNRTDDSTHSSTKLCTVDGHDVQCEAPYKNRASFRSVLTLDDLEGSDSGVYSVLDTINQELIATYSLTVTGSDQGLRAAAAQTRTRRSQSDGSEKEACIQNIHHGIPVWGFVLVVGLLVLLSLGVFIWQYREIQKLNKRCKNYLNNLQQLTADDKMQNNGS